MFKSVSAYTGIIFIGFSLDFLLFTFLVKQNVSAYHAHAVGFLIGMTVNVILLRHFLDKQPRFNLFMDLGYTIAANGIVFLLGLAVLWIAIELIELNKVLSKVFSSAITVCINFIVRKSLFSR